MKKGVETDLVDAGDAIESLLARLPKMSMEDKVDLGARIRGIKKNVDKIDESVKDAIKAELKGKEGTILGVIFKSMLKLVPTDRCNTKALKEAEPETYDRFVETTKQERVTYEPR